MDRVLRRASAPQIERAIGLGPIHVPAGFETEVYVAVRRLLLRLVIDVDTAALALFDIRRLRAEHHRVGDLLPEALALRDRFGGHDVFYALLAKRLGAPLVTADGPLARAARGYGVDVRYVPPG